MQTGSDAELELVYQSYVCSNAFEIEKKTHDQFKEYHVRGEWYQIDINEVIRYLENQQFVLKSEFMKQLIKLISEHDGG